MDLLYAVVKSLVLPPGLLLVLLALAFLLVRGTLGRLVLFIAWSLLLILAVPALSLPLIAPLEQAPALSPAAAVAAGAGAIVVLGADNYTNAPEYGGDTTGRFTLERVRYGAWLHRHTGLPVYVTGGRVENPVGVAMARVLTEDFGVPVAGVESQSRTTWENASLTKPLLAAAGIDHVLLVTHAWHMPRAVAAFGRVGLKVTAAPTAFAHRLPDDDEDLAGAWLARWLPQAPHLLLASYAVHELLGQVWYDLRARLAPPGAVADGAAN